MSVSAHVHVSALVSALLRARGALSHLACSPKCLHAATHTSSPGTPRHLYTVTAVLAYLIASQPALSLTLHKEFRNPLGYGHGMANSRGSPCTASGPCQAPRASRKMVQPQRGKVSSLQSL